MFWGKELCLDFNHGLLGEWPAELPGKLPAIPQQGQLHIPTAMDLLRVPGPFTAGRLGAAAPSGISGTAFTSVSFNRRFAGRSRCYGLPKLSRTSILFI